MSGFNISSDGDLNRVFITDAEIINRFVNYSLFSWGNNYNGQLGDNTLTTRSSPVTTAGGGTNWKQVAGGSYHTAAIKTDGTLWTWGWNLFGQLGNNTLTNRSSPAQTIAGGTNWKQVACGTAFSVALSESEGW